MRNRSAASFETSSEEELEKLHRADGESTLRGGAARPRQRVPEGLATPGRYLLLETERDAGHEQHLADFSDTADELKAQRDGDGQETVALGVFDALDSPSATAGPGRAARPRSSRELRAPPPHEGRGRRPEKRR